MPLSLSLNVGNINLLLQWSMWYFMHFCVVFLYYIQQFQVKRQVRAAEPRSIEKHWMQIRIRRRIWETYSKKLAVLDKSHLLHSLPKQPRKQPSQTCLQWQVNHWTEECAHWQNREKLPSFSERGKGAKWHPAGKRSKEEQGMHGGIIRQCYTQEPAAQGSCSSTGVLHNLKLWKKEHSCVLCLLYYERTFHFFTLCSLLGMITQWTTGVNISI